MIASGVADGSGGKRAQRKETVTIGSGSAAATDGVTGARDIAEGVRVDYLCFDAMSEKTMPVQQLARARDPELGYDARMVERLAAVVPSTRSAGTRIIGNFGGVNPASAGRRVGEYVREAGLSPLKIGVVSGDDILTLLRSDPAVLRHEEPGGIDMGSVVSANAYIGIEGVCEALDGGADIVVTGRVADPSLYLAPMVFELGWSAKDWDLLGAGTVLGHLLECGPLATGGYWAQPGIRMVPNIARIGHPIATVRQDGTATISKAPGTGGMVAVENLKAHLMHEIHDPTGYITPDVVADLTTVRFSQVEEDVVSVSWEPGRQRGRERPERLKVLVGVLEGHMGEAWIVVGGFNAVAKARLLQEVARDKMAEYGLAPMEFRGDVIGVNGTLGQAAPNVPPPSEVVLRLAAIFRDEDQARRFARFADELMPVGPIGMGERRQFVQPTLKIVPGTVERGLVAEHVELIEV